MSAQPVPPPAVEAAMEALGCKRVMAINDDYVCVAHWRAGAWLAAGHCSEATRVAAAVLATVRPEAVVAAESLEEAAGKWDDDASSLARVSSRYVRNSLLRRAAALREGRES